MSSTATPGKSSRPRRPASVVVSQVVLLLVGLGTLVSGGRILLSPASVLNPTPARDVALGALRLAIVVLPMLWAPWALYRRRPEARFLAPMILILVASAAVGSMLVGGSRAVAAAEPRSGAEYRGELFGLGLSSLLAVWLAGRLVFGEAEKRYLGRMYLLDDPLSGSRRERKRPGGGDSPG